VVLKADTNYAVPPTREGVKVFPSSTHLLSKLRGPLSVEGGVSAADRSLKNGVKLPAETDKPLFAIGPQPEESKMIDVLNIYNDASQQDWTGTMTSTTLRGFGMAKDLTFTGTIPATFGEATVNPTFPGGISFGAITLVDGQFKTDGAKSSIEVLNLMLGQGNDALDVQGTLDPVAPVLTTNTFTFTQASTTAGTVTLAGFD